MKNSHDNTAAGSPLPWEAQPDDPARSLEAFAVYRDLGPGRSLRKAATALGRSRSLLEGWSSEHGWVERVKAYDAHLDRTRREAREKAMLRAQAKGDAINNEIDDALLGRLQGDTDVAPLDPNQIGWKDTANLLRVRLQAERTAQPRPAGATITAGEAVAEVKAVIEVGRRHMTDDTYKQFLRDYQQHTDNPDTDPRLTHPTPTDRSTISTPEGRKARPNDSNRDEPGP